MHFVGSSSGPLVTIEVVVGYLVILMLLVEIPGVTSRKVKIVTHSEFPELNLPLMF